MILIFKTIHGEKVATPNWTVEANNNKRCIEITYQQAVNRELVAEVVQLNMLLDDFILQLHNASKTGICNLSHISGAR